eukprot:2651504-Rhodomonas_salina.1
MQTWVARFTVMLPQQLGQRTPVGSSKQSRGMGKNFDSHLRPKLEHEAHFLGTHCLAGSASKR